jgi:Tfp pilus assembly protein PilV
VRRGVSLVEAVIAIAVMAITLAVLVSVISTGYRQAGHDRNRVLGTLWAESTLEEIQAHRYGAPHPDTWGTLAQPVSRRIELLVEGRPVQVDMTRYVESATDKGGNLSFFDAEISNSGDVLRIHITWTASLPGHSEEHELEVFTDVWRHDVTTRGL